MDAKVAIPHYPLEKGIHQCHDQCRGAQLGCKARSLRNPARDDRRYGSCERQEEKALDQGVAIIGRQGCGRLEKRNPVGHPIADEEIGDRRHGEIAQNLGQGVDLIFVAYGANLKKREAGMHGEHQNGAYQDEQRI